jgi:hypothetical protein
MGCWNGTCMISNLPIRSRDRIKLVILYSPYTDVHRLTNTSGYCETTDLLRPAFHPISGVYNDYGGIEEIDKDWSYDFITKVLKKNFKSIEVETQIVDDYLLEDFIFGIERGSLKVMLDEDGEIYDYSRFSYVIIREDIWNGIITNQINYKTYWNDQDEKDENGDRIYYVDTKTYCDRGIETSLGIVQRWKNIGIDAPPDTLFFHFDNRPYDNSEHVTYFLDKIQNNEQIRKDYTELTIIRTYLNSIRKGWMVQPGAGSQNDDIKPYLLLCDLIKEISKEFEDYEDE